jgi:hypothetical protein
VAAHLDDLVEELEVVVRPDLGDHPQLLVRARPQERFEHAGPGVSVEVRRPTVARLAEPPDVHRHVAQRVLVLALDDRQIDVEGRDPDAGGHPILVRLHLQRADRRLRLGRGGPEWRERDRRLVGRRSVARDGPVVGR